jgi:hypothetical protein
MWWKYFILSFGFFKDAVSFSAYVMLNDRAIYE